MRRAAGEDIGGRVRLCFEWDITARGLLALKLAALERVLSQRTEILCMLHPVSPRMAAAWGAVPHGQPQRSGGGSTAADGTVAAPLPGTLAAQVRNTHCQMHCEPGAYIPTCPAAASADRCLTVVLRVADVTRGRDAPARWQTIHLVASPVANPGANPVANPATGAAAGGGEAVWHQRAGG